MDTSASMTYISVVSRESVSISLIIAELNDLDTFSDNSQNAYINAPPRKKAWFWAGNGFGQYEGWVVFIIHAIYGMS